MMLLNGHLLVKEDRFTGGNLLILVILSIYNGISDWDK